MRYLTREWLFRFIAIMLMVTTYLPIVSNNLPPIIRSHHIWTPIWFFCLLTLAPRTLQNKTFLYTLIAGFFFVFLLMDFIWPYTTDWNRELAINELYVFSVAVSLYAYFWTYKDFDGVAIVVKWALVFIGITAVMTIISAQVDPLYARHLTGGEYTGGNEITKFGGGSYAYGASLLCLLPTLIFFFKKNREIRVYKLIIVGYILLCFWALIKMQFFANILLATLLIGFSFVSSKNLKKTTFLVAIIGMIFLLIPTDFYVRLLYKLAGLFNESSNLHFKLNELAIFLKASGVAETNAFSARAGRYPMLLGIFFEHPIFGYFSSPNSIDIGLGAHLYWMNKLTIYGLFGFVPFVTIYVLFLNYSQKKLGPNFKKYYYIAISGFIMLGLMKALTGREFWYMVFFILPGTFFFYKKRAVGNN